MKTTLHKYRFDLRNATERAQWETLSTELSRTHPHCMESHGGELHYAVPFNDGATVTLEDAHLFDNQWNTINGCGSESGYRVFDWALDFEPNRNRNIKQGYYLAQTDEMREARRNRHACGYCGKQEPAQTASAFCPHCIDSEYLKASDLHLTRMQSVADKADRAPLSVAEKAHLLPLYRDAQLHGTTERGKARKTKQRADILAKCDRVTRQAIEERDGFLWLLDRGFRIDNVIFYTHTGRFGFGWRQPLSADMVSGLLDIISEFPFDYDLTCADGRKLSS